MAWRSCTSQVIKWMLTVLSKCGTHFKCHCFLPVEPLTHNTTWCQRGCEFLAETLTFPSSLHLVWYAPFLLAADVNFFHWKHASPSSDRQIRRLTSTNCMALFVSLPVLTLSVSFFKFSTNSSMMYFPFFARSGKEHFWLSVQNLVGLIFHSLCD